MAKRIEHDSVGDIEVDTNVYWGAQTQCSLQNFKIGTQKMPLSLIHAFAIQKKCCAVVNCALELLTRQKCDAIMQVCDEIEAGHHDDQFPLVIFQTGSGTQTNMNVNEVIANRTNELLGHERGTMYPVHPNDDVNKSQSSNDSFPTVMHIATVTAIQTQLLPALNKLAACLHVKEHEFATMIKIGRTHCQDAVPITMGQVFSGYAAQIDQAVTRIEQGMQELCALAQGGTAVGTGLNAHPEFANRFAQQLSALTGYPFTSATNKFTALACHDPLVHFSGILNTLATSLMKIANDIRLLGSGPRCGLNELILPENEPGSSIMPGKVNPTQCEAMTMVCAQVMGYHHTISISGMSGQFELNVFKPVIIYNILQSIELLSDACYSFVDHCVQDIQVNQQTLQDNLARSLMLVTALNPHIGYDKAAQIAKYAFKNNLTLRQAGIKLNILTDEQFSQWINPQKMV